MKKKKNRNSKNINTNVLMTALLIAVLSFVSIGFAVYNKTLGISGGTNLGMQGIIAITDVTLTSSKNVKDGSVPSFTNNSIDFNLVFEKPTGSLENSYQAVYTITIDNDTFYDYEFNLANFEPVITNSSGISVDSSYLQTSLSGINVGDMIKAGDSVTFTLTLDFNPPDDDTYSVDGNMDTELTEEPHGSLLGSLGENTEGDLRESLGNDITSFTITVINSYQTSRTFNINTSDTSHFILTNSDGTSLSSFTIDGGTTDTFTFYVKRKSGAIFTVDRLTTSIYLSYSENSNVNCGSVTLLVDEEEYVDTTPPVINSVSAVINNATSDVTTNNNVGSVTVTCTGEDAESGIKKYYIVAQNGNNSTTYETDNNNCSYTITGLADGTYSFKVYAENNDGYKPSDEQTSGSCNSNVCLTSSDYQFDWHYTVSYSSDTRNMRALSQTAVNRGFNFTTTLQANNNYNLPNSLNYVTMDGSEISATTGTESGHYKYTRSSGAFNVYGATGDIVIKVTPTINGCN